MKLWFFLLCSVHLGLQVGCRPAENTPELSALAQEKTQVPKENSSKPKPPSMSQEKLKSAKEAALRRDIQLKKEEMARKRQDLDRTTSQAETAKDRVAKLEGDIASTVPERIPINTSSDTAVFGSVVDQRRANQAAEEKKAQLRVEAEKQRADLKVLETKILGIEQEVETLEAEIELLNQELTDIATGKKQVVKS